MATDTEPPTTDKLLATFQTQDFQDLWAVASDYNKQQFIDEQLNQLQRRVELLTAAGRLFADGSTEAATALVKYVLI